DFTLFIVYTMSPSDISPLSLHDALPICYGTNGLGYNVTKVKEIMGDDYDFRDWSNLFDPEKIEKLRGCGISILDEAAQVLPAVLHYLCIDSNSSEVADYRDAIEVLKIIILH